MPTIYDMPVVIGRFGSQTLCSTALLRNGRPTDKKIWNIMYFSTSIVVIVFMYVPSSPPGRAHCLSPPGTTDRQSFPVCLSIPPASPPLAGCVPCGQRELIKRTKAKARDDFVVDYTFFCFYFFSISEEAEIPK